MLLKVGDKAPDFEVRSIQGEMVRLSDCLGSKVLLCFYRYAQCSYCNYYLKEVILHQKEYRRFGMKTIVFFQSPSAAVLDFPAKKNPDFPLIADPEREVYERYHVHSSVLKAALTYLHPGIVYKTHQDEPKNKVIDGDPVLIPAEFLIDEEGKIASTHYASHLGDHISVTEIMGFLTKREHFE